MAWKLLFAHRKSSVTCKIVNGQQLSEDEIHVRRSVQEETCLKVLVSPVMSDKLETIRKEFKDPSQHLAPVFIPTIRPGQTSDLQGNYLLEEDPWSISKTMDDQLEQEKSEESPSDLNIFLVVEQQHL